MVNTVRVGGAGGINQIERQRPLWERQAIKSVCYAKRSLWEGRGRS